MASGIIPRHGPQPKGEENHPHMEEIVRIAAKPIAYIGATVLVIGLIYLGIQLKDGLRGGGGELVKAIALIASGGVVTGVAALYGFTGF